MTSSPPGGTYQLGDLTVSRVGFGAMRLAGPGVFGPPADRDQAVAVLREAAELGVTHIDTADFYGPYITNELIHEALAPYPDDVHIVTKVGAVRDAAGGWIQQRSPAALREQVYSNLRNLKLDVLDVVNLRVGGGNDGHSPVPGPIAEQFGALAELRARGLIRHLGLSTVDADQLAEARAIAPVVCVQNFYNVARREDDALVELTTSEHRVLYHMMRGASASDIAEQLIVSLATVRSHIRSILRKLGVSSQLAAVALANGSHPDMTNAV